MKLSELTTILKKFKSGTIEDSGGTTRVVEIIRLTNADAMKLDSLLLDAAIAHKYVADVRDDVAHYRILVELTG